MYYAESNEAGPNRPVLVLVHGAGYDHRCWPLEMRRLNGWRVLTVDLPGHGRSGNRPRQSVAAYAHDLADFLNELELYRVVLVGHSLGAAVALQLALEQPDLLAGLGLISASPHLTPPPSLVDYFSNPLTISLGVMLFQQWAFSPQTHPTEVEAAVEPLRGARPSTLAGDWQAFARYEVESGLNHITTPAWVAVGGDDRLTPLPCAHYLSVHLPAARLQVVANAGHMLPIERPATLAAGLRAFLADLPLPAAAAATVAVAAMAGRGR
jgi:pimeloyl-ACP methyl ester carboxylesterase